VAPALLDLCHRGTRACRGLVPIARGVRLPRPFRRLAGAATRLGLLTGVVVGVTSVAALADAPGGGTDASPLPLLRWTNAVATIHTHYGVGSVLSAGDPFLTAISALIFQISALLWQVLGTLVNAAQGASTVHFTVERINPIYHQIGAGLLGTTGDRSIVVIVVLAASGMVAYQAYRRGSGIGGALRGLAGVLGPVGLLAVTVQVAGDVPSATMDAPGSPAWAVGAVTGWTDTLSGTVAAVFEGLRPVSGESHHDTGVADCTRYIAGLENLYAQRNHLAGAGPEELQAADSIVLSQLWESAVMRPWVSAQFGAGPLGEKAFCHLLEVQGDVSAADQVLAMQSDVPNGTFSPGTGPTWSQLVLNAGGYVGPGNPRYVVLLGPGYAHGDDDLRRNMIAWATCDYIGKPAGDDGWTVNPAFAKVFETPPNDVVHTCSTWWNAGNTKPPPTDGNLTTNGPFDFQDENTIQTATTRSVDSAQARSYIQGLNGHNAGLAASTALIALVSSITYAWSLGGLALGVLIGKLSLIILVACTPIFLLLGAIPSATTRRAATKAFGLLFAALLSTFTFSVLMGLLLLFIGLLQSVSAGLFDTPGTVAGLVGGLVPLAALYLLRKLLRLVGMDSITSLRGAIKTTAAFGRMGAGTSRPADLLGALGGLAILSRLSKRYPTTSPAGAGGDPSTAAGGRAGGRRSSVLSKDRPDPAAAAGPPTQALAPLAWNETWKRLRTGPDPAPAPPAPLPLPAGPPTSAAARAVRATPVANSSALRAVGRPRPAGALPTSPRLPAALPGALPGAPDPVGPGSGRTLPALPLPALPLRSAGPAEPGGRPELGGPAEIGTGAGGAGVERVVARYDAATGLLIAGPGDTHHPQGAAAPADGAGTSR